MLESRTPLADAQPFSHTEVRIAEVPGFILTQLSGSEKAMKQCLGKLPNRVGVVLAHEGVEVFRISSKQVWVLGPVPRATTGVYTTPLSS